MAKAAKRKPAPAQAPNQDTEAAKTAGAVSPEAGTGKPDASGNTPPAKDRPAGPPAGEDPSGPVASPHAGQGGTGERRAGPRSPVADPSRSREVLVTGPAKGRWRIGRKFGPEPVAVDLDELSEDEQDRLLADPELTVAPYAAPEQT